MAGEYQDFFRTLKEKLNIIEVASSYLSLERKGGSWWACCPFHHEKTPSFAINESGQYYHCFGCGESGDAIKFVSAMENIDFMDAVKMLAEKANLPMPQTAYDNRDTAELKRRRDAQLKILNDTAHFYLDNLNGGKADKHIEYILSRKIPSKLVRQFGLGASLNFYDLPRHLLSKGYAIKDIVDSGVCAEVDGKLIDALGGRLIFPIINALGEVIAFGGRNLVKTDFAKYKNTKDTLIFNKKKNLYNINLLKKLKREQTVKQVIMVEGYMDTISLYQAGFKNVVASMGTSLTQEQARLIKRFVDTVLISYDGDGAGQDANVRGLEILKNEGLNVKVVPLPDGLDPDDVIKQHGVEGYQKCLDNAMPLIDYKMLVERRKYDLTKTDEKRKYVSEAIKIIKTADSATEQEELLKRLREETGVTYESLSRDLSSSQPPREPTVKREPTVPNGKETPELMASRFVISAFLFGWQCANDVDIDSIVFVEDVHKMIARYVKSKRYLEEKIFVSELFEFFDSNSPQFAEMGKVLDYSEGSGMRADIEEKYFAGCVRLLLLSQADKEIERLKAMTVGITDSEKLKEIGNQITQAILLKDKIKRGD